MKEKPFQKWCESIQAFATAGRLTAKLTIFKPGNETVTFCLVGNSLGELLNNAGLVDTHEELLKIEKTLFDQSIVEKKPLSKTILGCMRLAVIPLIIEDRVLAKITYGYAIDRFVSPEQCRRLQKHFNLPFTDLWRAIRHDSPVTDDRFEAIGSLANNLVNQIMEETGLKYNLRQALRVKDDFIASVTHELRTPLQILQLQFELLEHKGTKEPEDLSWDDIRQNLDQLSTLIAQLFEYARLNGKKLNLKIEQTDVSEALRRLVDAFSLHAQRKGKAIQFKNEIEKGAFARLDQSRFQQVISNLLDNALKFSEDNSQIDISLTQVKNGLLVKIKDYGTGMSPGFLQHAFEKFSQENPKVSHRGEGLGLGLTICKEIMMLHGGTITLESEGLGKGVTVSTLWPNGN